MKLGKCARFLAGLGLIVLAVVVVLPHYESRKAEQPVKRRLEQIGIRFWTENGRVVDAFSPHSFIPESCLDDLAKFKHLKRLNLSGSRLSDVGIAKICQMRQLESVDLSMTFATRDQFDAISRALPNCKIFFDGTFGVPASGADPPATNPDHRSE